MNGWGQSCIGVFRAGIHEYTTDPNLLPRALCIARGDTRPLPGFDEKAYAQMGSFDSRLMRELLADYEAVRNASVTLFLGLDSEAWLRRGIANGYDVTPRGLAFHIAGHELHHHRIVRERYLPLLRAGSSGSR